MRLSDFILNSLEPILQSWEDFAGIHMLVKPEDFALVVTDHGVPGQIKGAEFLHMVAQRWQKLPTIFTSGYEL